MESDRINCASVNQAPPPPPTPPNPRRRVFSAAVWDKAIWVRGSCLHFLFIVCHDTSHTFGSFTLFSQVSCWLSVKWVFLHPCPGGNLFHQQVTSGENCLQTFHHELFFFCCCCSVLFKVFCCRHPFRCDRTWIFDFDSFKRWNQTFTVLMFPKQHAVLSELNLHILL